MLICTKQEINFIIYYFKRVENRKNFSFYFIYIYIQTIVVYIYNNLIVQKILLLFLIRSL